MHGSVGFLSRSSAWYRFVIFSVVLALSLFVVTACGDSDDAASESGAGSERSVSGKFGETIISGVPERVVPLSPQDADFVLATGMTPIAIPVYPDTLLATEGTGVWAWQREALGDNEPEKLQLAEDAGAVAEAIAALNPDIIVATGFWGLNEDVYAKLSAIAPVVHFDSMANGEPWQDSQLKVGKALKRESEAQDAVDKAEANIVEVRDEHPEYKGKTFNAVIGDMNNQLYVLASPERGIGMLISSLGLELDPDVYDLRTDADGRGLLSYEEIPRIDADVVFVVSASGDTGYLTERPLWFETTAAKEGHAISLPRNSGIPSAAGFPSPLSIQWCLGQFTNLISKVVT